MRILEVFEYALDTEYGTSCAYQCRVAHQCQNHIPSPGPPTITGAVNSNQHSIPLLFSPAKLLVAAASPPPAGAPGRRPPRLLQRAAARCSSSTSPAQLLPIIRWSTRSPSLLNAAGVAHPRRFARLPGCRCPARRRPPLLYLRGYGHTAGAWLRSGHHLTGFGGGGTGFGSGGGAAVWTTTTPAGFRCYLHGFGDFRNLLLPSRFPSSFLIELFLCYQVDPPLSSHS
ncbi:unnamed protein product [Urochloa humidicola]